jgi:hypothetical protein
MQGQEAGTSIDNKGDTDPTFRHCSTLASHLRTGRDLSLSLSIRQPMEVKWRGYIIRRGR